MWKLDAAKSALIVVDMQNDFVLEGAPMEVPNARKAIPHIQRLIAASRKLDIPVFFTKHTLLEDAFNSPLEAEYNPKLFDVGMRKGTPGWQVGRGRGGRGRDPCMGTAAGFPAGAGAERCTVQ